MFDPLGQGDERIVDFVWRCWRLEMLCARCARRVSWGPDVLKAKFKPGVTLAQIGAKLRCACGSRDGALYSYQDGGATAARDIARFGADEAMKDARKQARNL